MLAGILSSDTCRSARWRYAASIASISVNVQTFLWDRQGLCPGPVFSQWTPIYLSKPPTGFCLLLFKLGKVREILESRISGKVPLYCLPFSAEQSYLKDLGLISGASFAREISVCQGGIKLAFYKSSKFCHTVPFHVFVLVLSCFWLQGLTRARIVGGYKKSRRYHICTP